MSKELIRIRMKQERNSITSEGQLILNQSICNQLFQTEKYKTCTKLFSYLSFGSEVDTWQIIRKAMKDNKRVFLPRVEGRMMNFYEIDNLDNLLKSRFGIYEPPIIDKNRYKVPPKSFTSLSNNLMLLPGLAFDLRGNRIGYGAGYYDHYLIQFSDDHFYKMALAYDLQIVDSCEAKAYDIRVHEIITPTQRMICNTQYNDPIME